MSKLQELNRKCAAETFKKYCTFLKQYDSHYPCLQISGAQECLKMCFNILLKNISMSLLSGL